MSAPRPRSFKCATCDDIDLCGTCMRALVAARIRMAQEAGPLSAPPRQVMPGAAAELRRRRAVGSGARNQRLGRPLVGRRL